MTTFGQLLERIKDDLDIEDTENPFISDEDIRQYMNEAIEDAESEIHNIYEDYFLQIGALTMTNGSKSVTFPTNIYANKIRKLFYFPTDKNLRYEVKPIRDKQVLMDVESNDDYQYHIINDSVAGNHIELEPASRETSTNLKCLYIREARKFLTDGTEDAIQIDIPEFQRFLRQHAVYHILLKDGSPMAAEAKENMDRYRVKMVETLNRSVPDDNDVVAQDLSFYQDFTGSFLGEME